MAHPPAQKTNRTPKTGAGDRYENQESGWPDPPKPSPMPEITGYFDGHVYVIEWHQAGVTSARVVISNLQRSALQPGDLMVIHLTVQSTYNPL